MRESGIQIVTRSSWPNPQFTLNGDYQRVHGVGFKEYFENVPAMDDAINYLVNHPEEKFRIVNLKKNSIVVAVVDCDTDRKGPLCITVKLQLTGGYYPTHYVLYRTKE